MRPRSLRVRVGLATALSILVALAVLGSILLILLGRQRHDGARPRAAPRATRPPSSSPPLRRCHPARRARVAARGSAVVRRGGRSSRAHRRPLLGARCERCCACPRRKQALAGRGARDSVRRSASTPLRVPPSRCPREVVEPPAAASCWWPRAPTRSMSTLAEAPPCCPLGDRRRAGCRAVAAGLARRALRPPHGCQTVAVHRTDERSTPTATEPATGDELSELAGTLNTMPARSSRPASASGGSWPTHRTSPRRR